MGHPAYHPFGGESSFTVNTLQTRRYTGKPLDEEMGLDLYYYGARYYNPDLGRFLAVDPLARKYPSWGPYVYTYDNPIKFIDPDGKAGVLAPMAIGAGVGFAAGAGAELFDQSFKGGDLLDSDSWDFSNIDVGDVLISGGEGAVVGATAPLAVSGFGVGWGAATTGLVALDASMVGTALKGDDLSASDFGKGFGSALGTSLGGALGKLAVSQQGVKLLSSLGSTAGRSAAWIAPKAGRAAGKQGGKGIFKKVWQWLSPEESPEETAARLNANPPKDNTAH